MSPRTPLKTRDSGEGGRYRTGIDGRDCVLIVRRHDPLKWRAKNPFRRLWERNIDVTDPSSVERVHNSNASTLFQLITYIFGGAGLWSTMIIPDSV